MPQFDRRICRPCDHLIAASQLYPQAWAQADRYRSARGADVPDWPDWCYLPMAAWYAIVSADAGVARLDGRLVSDVARLAALGAWRVTQGIYRFDPALHEAVAGTPVAGDIPCDVLYRLPEWCIYLETPGLQYAGAVLHGVWAHLEADAGTGRPELRLLTDADTGLLPIVLHLGSWTLAEAVKRAVNEAARQGRQAGMAPLADMLAGTDMAKILRPVVEPVLSMLLYLCSQAAEIGDGVRAPKNPEPKRTKRGWRLFAPDRPTTWDVGVRIGSALRRAYQTEQTGGAGAHAGPRPHVRRAHWHGFRSGAMKTAEGATIPAERRQFELRWLPPIMVNLDDAGDLSATIRPVKS